MEFTLLPLCLWFYRDDPCPEALNDLLVVGNGVGYVITTDIFYGNGR